MYRIAGVPSTYQTLLRNSSLPRRGLKTLRKVQQAGESFKLCLLRMMAALPEAQIYVMYGQTEATARLSYLPPTCLKLNWDRSAGHPGCQAFSHQ